MEVDAVGLASLQEAQYEGMGGGEQCGRGGFFSGELEQILGIKEKSFRGE